MISDKYTELLEKYKVFGQQHVFNFFDSLDSIEKKKFLEQLDSVDVERVHKIWVNLQTNGQAAKLDSKFLEPLLQVKKAFADDGNYTKEALKWNQEGLLAIKAGEIAALTLAGGQGTRLGSSSPKGCYNIGLPSKKSLFQIQAERIISLQRLAGCSSMKINWYIMTSGPTHQETFDFFVNHNYFGLDKSQVHFFQQGVLPCLTFEGKIMLEAKGRLSLSPDGNGGIFAALHSSGTINHMKQRNIKYVHMYSVDNCLVRVADPVFVGYCKSQNADSGIKVVSKAFPQEPVGVVCKYKNKFSVVEYSEIEKEVSERLDSNGGIIFKHANIANHIFSVDFLDKVVETGLSYHIAKKKITTVDLTNGSTVKPVAPNGIKLELFVFDVLPTLDNIAVLEVLRSDEFSPLKNAPGSSEDSPETSRRDILKLNSKFVTQAGGKFIPAADGIVECEISPLVSYAGEGLESLKGKSLQSPILFSNSEDLKKF